MRDGRHRRRPRGGRGPAVHDRHAAVGHGDRAGDDASLAHIGDLVDTPVEVIRRVIEVNLVGVVLCARRAAQLMSVRGAGGGGAIVNVSSAAATLGSAHEYVHYAAAKAAVDAFTVGLAKELAGDKIRVNAVAPGIVRTRIHADAGDPRPRRSPRQPNPGRASG